jgi:chromosome segregation ATPase
MSLHYSTNRDPFKFHLQEEKVSQLRAKTQMDMKQSLYHTKDISRENNSLNEFNNIFHENADFNNEFIRNLTDRYKKEIDMLKNYIHKVNKEIRKQLNIEIPALTEELTKEENMNEFLNLLNEAFKRLQNPEYVNPLFKLYEDHINNLEAELGKYKQLCTKYETQITEFTKENSSLRDNLILKTNEQIDLLKVRSSGGKMIYDEEYIKQVDMRNDLLSRENEILLLNYQNLTNEFNNFNNLYADKHKESLEKIALYDTISDELHRVNTVLDNAMYRAQINENKTMELSEAVSRLEMEKTNLVSQVESLRSDNKNLIEAVDFYKNYINKINNI